MANYNGKTQSAFKEELSSKTLELMLFREMLVNQEFLGRLSDVVDFRWFRTPHIRLMAEFAVGYFRKYGGLVSRDMMESVIQRRNENQVIEANKIDINTALYDFNKAKELDLGSMDKATQISKIQEYVKQEAMRNALLDSAENLEKKDTDGVVENTLKKFDDIQKILFEEMDFGVEMSAEEVEDSMEEHIDYLTNPAARIASGWNCLDEITHGGFFKDGKFLGVFMAQAGLGKSNILANLGYNFLRQNLKVAVISMEMSQNVYLRRFDSLISKIDIDSLGLSSMVGQLKEKITKFYKFDYPGARLNVKEFAPNSKSSKNIEQYVEELVVAKGWKPDVLIIDYLNLLKPNASSSRADSTMYEDGKVVSEELRAMSYHLQIPVLTAVQCNSSGFNTADIGMQNIAESRGIAHTADFIAGLYQTEDEQMDGVFHMKILKSRLGDKANLKFEFDKHTMEFKDINDVMDSDAAKETVANSTGSNLVKKQIGLTRCQVDDEDLFKNDLGMP
jgi:replicative DNA helicase